MKFNLIEASTFLFIGIIVGALGITKLNQNKSKACPPCPNVWTQLAEETKCNGALVMAMDFNSGERACFRGVSYREFLVGTEQAAFFKQEWENCINSIDEKTMCVKAVK